MLSFFREETLKKDNIRVINIRLYFFLFLNLLLLFLFLFVDYI